MTCLARLPSRRFPDASFVLQALDSGGVNLPQRLEIPRRLAVAALLVLVVAGGFVAWRAWNPVAVPDLVDGTPETAGGPVNASASRPAIAVLGFRNLANRTDAQWMATALAEMVTTELGAGEAVRTVPGENVNRMKSSWRSPTPIRTRPKRWLGFAGIWAATWWPSNPEPTVGDGGDARCASTSASRTRATGKCSRS